MDFKCDKCDSNEGVISSQKERTTTILKDNAKPILKFSVSAILGDKKECARVRHGKICIDLLFYASNAISRVSSILLIVFAQVHKCSAMIEHFFVVH